MFELFWMAMEVQDRRRALLESLADVVRQVAGLSECRSPLKRQYANLARRVKLLGPLFEELGDGEPAIGEADMGSYVCLKSSLEAALSLLRYVNEGSRLFQV